MNSSPDSVVSMDEIVFVPLMIDESEPPSRLRSYRRKPKHPQKLSTTHYNLQQHQQTQHQQQHHKSQQQQRRGYFGQCSSSDSSGEQSSGESQNESLSFYFGEQTRNSSFGEQIQNSSFGEQTHNSFSSSDEGRFDESREDLEKFPSSGELSYNDLTSPDFPTSPSIKVEGSSSASTASSTRELFVPAPNGDGYYILTTTSPTPLRNDPVQPKVEKDDGGFSIYDNMPLDENGDDDDDEDEDDEEGILTANHVSQIIRRTARSSSSSSCRPTKLKILTMEMRPAVVSGGDGRGGKDGTKSIKTRPKIVETTLEITADEDMINASDSSKINEVDDGEMMEEDRQSHPNRQLLGDWIHCGQCERVFDNENRMRRHMKLVHGPKSFFCPECNKSFTQYGHMQVHLRTVHTSAKPFECYVCHRRFNVSSNRNRHQRLHFTKGSLHFVPNGATIVVTGKDQQDEANENVDNKEA